MGTTGSGAVPVTEHPIAPSLLERVGAQLCRSAARLRASGEERQACRAEQFAVRVGLMRDAPKATRRMHLLIRHVYEAPESEVMLARALAGAMSLIGAELGNIQTRDPATGKLTIAVQSGFSGEFLEYFAVVDDDSSACGRAAERRSQTVIADVNEDAAFAAHREIAAASGFRAVQSTPLIDSDGLLQGVMSTHFRRAHRPCQRDLQIVEWYGEYIAAVLTRPPHPPRPSYQSGGH